MRKFFVLVITSLLILSCGKDYEAKLAATAWNLVKMEFKPDPSNTRAQPWMIADYIEDSYVEFRNDTCYKLFSVVSYPYKLEGNKMHIENRKGDVIISHLNSDMLVMEIHVDSVGTYTHTHKAVPFNHHSFDVATCVISQKYMLQNYAAVGDSLYVFGIKTSPKQLEEEGNSIAEDIKVRIDKALNVIPIEKKNCPTEVGMYTYDSYTWEAKEFSIMLKNYFAKSTEAEPPTYFSSELEMHKVR